MLIDDSNFPQSLAFAFLEQYEELGFRLECISDLIWTDNHSLKYALRVNVDNTLDIPKTATPYFMFDENVLKLAIVFFLTEAFEQGNNYRVPVTYDMINAVFEIVKSMLYCAGTRQLYRAVINPFEIKQLIKENKVGQFRQWLSTVENNE